MNLRTPLNGRGNHVKLYEYVSVTCHEGGYFRRSIRRGGGGEVLHQLRGYLSVKVRGSEIGSRFQPVHRNAKSPLEKPQSTLFIISDANEIVFYAIVI
jgi:hypothetical protein